MTITFKFYLDSSLTTELTSVDQAFYSDGSSGAIDRQVYIGSTTPSKKLLAASNPGVDSIQIQAIDSNGATGQLAADIKLALTQGGLASSTGGAALAIAAQILSGVAQALPFWMRITPSNMAEGAYADLRLDSADTVERVQ